MYFNSSVPVFEQVEVNEMYKIPGFQTNSDSAASISEATIKLMRTDVEEIYVKFLKKAAKKRRESFTQIPTLINELVINELLTMETEDNEDFEILL